MTLTTDRDQAHDPSQKHSSLSNSLIGGFLWQYAAVGSQGIAQLLVLTVLSRLLKPEDFGVLGSAMIFVGFAALFSQLGVAPALVQRQQLTERHLRVGLTLSFAFGFVMVAVLWAVAPWIAHFFRDARIAPVLRYVSLTFLFSGIGVVSEALLQRRLQFRKLMWINLGSYVLGYGVIGIGLALNRFGVWALVGASVSQSVLKSLFLIGNQPIPWLPLVARAEARDLLRFGAGFTLARALNYGATQGDNLVVGRLLGADSLGTYSRAYQLMLIPATYFGYALERVLFPLMARVQEERAILTRLYLSGTTAIGLATAPIAVVMAVCAPEIIHVVLGSQWTNAVAPFQVLAVGILFRTSYKLGDSLAKARGAVYQRSAREAAYIVFVLTGSVIGSRWGLKGVAFGVLLAVFMNYLSAARLGLRLLGLGWRTYIASQAGAAVIAMVAFVLAALSRALWLRLHLPPVANLGLTAALTFAGAGIVTLGRPQFLGMHAERVVYSMLSWLERKGVPMPQGIRVKQAESTTIVAAGNRR